MSKKSKSGIYERQIPEQILRKIHRGAQIIKVSARSILKAKEGVVPESVVSHRFRGMG